MYWIEWLKHKCRKVLAALMVVLVAGLSSTSASAFTRLSPAWAKPAAYQRPNSSFLINSAVNENDSMAGLLDKKAAASWKQEFQDMTRSYDVREQYRLVSPDEQRLHSQQMSTFTLDILSRIKNYHFTENANLVRKAAEKDKIVQKLVKPIGFALLLAAAYSGQPLDFTLTDNAKLRASNNVPSRRGYFTLTSPVFDGSFAYALQAPTARNPYSTEPIDNPIKGEERYQFSVSRPLPFFGLTTALSYGATTTTLTGSLSREIFENLSCVVGASQNLTYTNSDGRSAEQTIKFLYGLTF